jgi:hypothetical protein
LVVDGLAGARETDSADSSGPADTVDTLILDVHDARLYGDILQHPRAKLLCDVTEYWNAQDTVNQAKNRTFGGMTNHPVHFH